MRLLGKTNIKIHEVGFGGIPIQRVNQQDVNDIVDELIKNNVNFIDTARGYTVSEEFIGNAIEGQRDLFFLCTKSMSRTYEAMKNDIEISLHNLKTDYIDLYQFHNLKTKEDYDLVMSDKGAYKALLEAQKEGKVKHIGLTSHSFDFLMTIIDNFPYETIQFPYNILETKAEQLFEKAKQHNIGVIVMKPLAGGAIDDAKLAIKFILNNPNISVVIPGMNSIEQVKENTSVKGGSYSNNEIEKIEKIRNDLGNDFCRRCGYCLPCSAEIDIPSCFMFEGYYTRYSLKEWAEGRYLALKKHASDCLECHECESRCPYNLPIVEKLKRVKSLFKQ